MLSLVEERLSRQSSRIKSLYLGLGQTRTKDYRQVTTCVTGNLRITLTFTSLTLTSG